MALGWLWVASVALGSKTLSQEGGFRLIMRLPRNLFARIAPMNFKMRKCLIINNRILRFMGRLSARHLSDGFPLSARPPAHPESPLAAALPNSDAFPFEDG